MSKFTLALIQMKTGLDKAENISRALQMIRTAATEHKAKLISLPECFNSPYGTQYFADYAEPIPGPTVEALAQAAKEHKVYLIGGSIPEKKGTALYNTATVFGPDGSLMKTFRKLHLFDIDIPGKITFRESDSLQPGSEFCVLDTGFCKVGVAICYDIRFAELGLTYGKLGCDLIVYPGAFNMTTGPAHWRLLQQARALDNQLYIAAVSPARDETAGYVAWGHSSIVSPWADVLAEADHTEQIVTAEVDPAYVQQVRSQIPITKQRRLDLYRMEFKA
ncbi:omega-amidase NIT2-like [Paramacrobiotus metropolitanus]|uniref:omega-amidase NIT2-like n=1 Tax=Paramacrobiotus metropolitanus TaxID=2943436 RepID=UPI00244636E4|nr:omega-amidase NIT2-like [Paramacrobiotus metropolitanus]